MLDGYFLANEGREKAKRLLAVQAALEIAKASALSADASVHSRMDDDMEKAAKNIEALADAIQKALEK
jgi:hypothetical protein